MTPDVIEKAIRALAEALASTTSGATATEYAATLTVTATVAPSWSAERFENAPDPVRLSVADLADAFGCSAKTIYRAVKKQGLPTLTRDGLMLFKVGEVKRWRDAREQRR